METSTVSSRLRVLYVADRDSASFRYRCLHACRQLRDAGVVANFSHLDAPDILTQIPRYSVVALFRLAWRPGVERIVHAARQSGASVAFEIDDLVFFPEAEALAPYVQRLSATDLASFRWRSRKLQQTFNAADFCIASTPTIASYAERLGKRCVQHDNLLSETYLTLSKCIYPLRPFLQRRPFIGYMSGSDTHDGDLESVAEAIADVLDEQSDVSLLLCGLVELPRPLLQRRTRIVRYDYQDSRVYPWLMARCRVLVAPAEQINDFFHAKSALKVFEAGVFGVPVVASPTAAYAEAIQHNVTGLLATSKADWVYGLRRLLAYGTSLRAGARARARALDRHSPSTYPTVLALKLLPFAGRMSGDAPTLVALDGRALPTNVPRPKVTGTVDLARQSLAAAFSATPLVPQSSPAATGEHQAGAPVVPEDRNPQVEVLGEDNAVLELLAAMSRRSQDLGASGRVIGTLIVDSQHPASDLDHNRDVLTVDGALDFRAVGYDPYVVIANIPARNHRFFIVEMRIGCLQAQPRAHLYWRCAESEPWQEANSVVFPVVANDKRHTYIVDLERSARVWPSATVCDLRFDPVDRPTAFEISHMALLCERPTVPTDATAERYLLQKRATQNLHAGTDAHEPVARPEQMAPLHEELRFHVERARQGMEQALMFIVHASPWDPNAGRMEVYLLHLIGSLCLPRALVAFPSDMELRVAEVVDGQTENPTFFRFPLSQPTERWCLHAPEVEDTVAMWVDLFGIAAVHVHNLQFWPVSLGRKLSSLGVPFCCTHHDFYAVCPNWSLYDYANGSRCGCSERGSGCLEALCRTLGMVAPHDLEGLRQKHRDAFVELCQHARVLIFLSEAARDTVCHYLPLDGVRSVVIQRGCDGAEEQTGLARPNRLRVGFILEEVSDPVSVVETCLEFVRLSSDLPVQWHFLGATQRVGFDDRIRVAAGTTTVIFHSARDRVAISRLLLEQQIDVCALLTTRTGTFSFALKDALATGVPVVVLRTGALTTHTGSGEPGALTDDVTRARSVLVELCMTPERPSVRAEAAATAIAGSAQAHRELYEQLGFLVSVPAQRRREHLVQLANARISTAKPAEDTDTATRRTNNLEATSQAQHEDSPTHVGWTNRLVPRALRQAGHNLTALVSTRPPRVLVPWAARQKAQMANVEIVSRELAACRFVARNHDPKITFTPKPFRADRVKAVRFRLRHELPGARFAQLFWCHSLNEAFSEGKSARVRLRPGTWNECTLRLDAPEHHKAWTEGTRIVRLRFDPIDAAGPFELGHIELCS